MNKIRLRTKIEAMLGTLLFIVILIVTVLAGPRIISDTHDDVYTFIINSNGNYWEATGENIDMALDDLTTDGWVSIPAGMFTINSTITNMAHNITIQGCGRNTVISLNDNSNCHVISVGGNGWTIKDLVIDGNGFNQGVGNWWGIYIDADNTTIENVGITKTDKSAIRVEHSHNYVNVRFCDIYYNYENGFDSEGDVNHVKIINCNFINGTSTPIYDDTVRNSIDWTISDCTFIRNGYRVRLNNVTGIKIDNCYFKECGGPAGETDGGGISLERCNYSSVSNCIVTGMYGSGLSLKGSTHIDVNNYQIYNNSVGGGIGISIMNDGSGFETSDVTFNGGLVKDVGATYLVILQHNTSNITFNGVTFMDDTNGLHLNGSTSNVKVVNCRFSDLSGDGISELWSSGISSNLSILGNTFESCGKGIDFDDGLDFSILNNNFISCTTSIDVNSANVVRPMIMNNNWYGCTIDTHYAAAINPRITSNINISGDWWTIGDNPS